MPLKENAGMQLLQRIVSNRVVVALRKTETQHIHVTSGLIVGDFVFVPFVL
jgi:hypothetical protein